MTLSAVVEKLHAFSPAHYWDSRTKEPSREEEGIFCVLGCSLSPTVPVVTEWNGERDDLNRHSGRPLVPRVVPTATSVVQRQNACEVGAQLRNVVHCRLTSREP